MKLCIEIDYNPYARHVKGVAHVQDGVDCVDELSIDIENPHNASYEIQQFLHKAQVMHTRCIQDKNGGRNARNLRIYSHDEEQR